MEKSTPSFVTTIPIAPSMAEAHQLSIRKNCANRVYNTSLKESEKRWNRLKHTNLYTQTRILRKTNTQLKALPPTKENQNEIKNNENKIYEIFKELKVQVGFSEYSIAAFASALAKTWLGQHLDAKTMEITGANAFKTYEKFIFGKIGQPKFRKLNGNGIIEGKSMSAAKWNKIDNTLDFFSMKINGRKLLSIPLQIDETDPVIQHAVNNKVKYNRIKSEKVNGKDKWYLQAVGEGKPFIKPIQIVKGRVGIDLNTDKIAVYAHGTNEAFFTKICFLENYEKEIRILQRKFDRQRRINNPNCYNPNGTNKVGTKAIYTKGMQETKNKLYEIGRKSKEYRKNQIRVLCNKIISMGDEFLIENNSVKQWQSKFGKAIGRHAPGMITEELKRITGKLNLKLTIIDTYETALSQTCFCGIRLKKELTNRTHSCKCGVMMNRDLFSAYLMCFIEDGKLHAAEASKSWQGSCNVLQLAWDKAEAKSVQDQVAALLSSQ